MRYLRKMQANLDKTPREAIALSFFFSLGARQMLTSLLGTKKEDPADRDKVNYRQKSFTKTKGGVTNMGILAGE